LLVIPLIAALYACQNGIRVGDRSFDSFGAALEYQAVFLEQSLNDIEPLDKPIAKAVTLIIPALEDNKAFVLATVPGGTDQAIEYLSRVLYNDYSFFERQLARSNRFERIEAVIQDEGGGDIVLPPGGYGLWVKNAADGTNLSSRHYMRAGNGEWRELDYRPQYVTVTQRTEMAANFRAFYAVVDKFIAEHPAQ
jgi:hypothetical protein